MNNGDTRIGVFRKSFRGHREYGFNFRLRRIESSRESRVSPGNWTLQPYLDINNLFDGNYNSNIRINAFGGRYFEPAPTRNSYAGIVVRFE